MKSKKKRLALKIERAKAGELMMIYSFAIEELSKLIQKENSREIHTGVAEIRDFVRCEKQALTFFERVLKAGAENGLR